MGGPDRTRSARGTAGAVVLGGDYQGLGIVRSLGRRGIPVCVIDDEPSISRFSRYTALSVRVSDLRDYGRAVESILETGRKHGLDGWVLYPTRDELVAAISMNRARLQEMFRVPTPGWAVVSAAWDKRLTYRLAEKLGIPFPRTWTASTADDLAGLRPELPLALKPAIKEHFIYASHRKALRADSPEELAAAFQEACSIIPSDEVLVQEMIPGGGECQFSYCALAKDGRPLASMTARRTRQHPPDFGRASTYVVTMAVPQIVGPSERLLSELAYSGLVEVEYKQDPRDGSFKLLDVNMRTWGYHSIGGPAGVDFPYLLYRDQTGQPIESCRAAHGVKWIRLITDLPTSLGEVFRGRLDAKDFLRTVTGFDTESVFSKDDPLPGIAELAHLPHLLRTRGTSRNGKEARLNRASASP